MRPGYFHLFTCPSVFELPAEVLFALFHLSYSSFCSTNPALRSVQNFFTRNRRLFEILLDAELGNTAAQRDRRTGGPVRFFASDIREAVIMGTFILSETSISEKNFLRGRLHNHDLRFKKGCDHVVVGSSSARNHCKALYYLYHFITSEDVPETLSEFYASDL